MKKIAIIILLLNEVCAAQTTHVINPSSGSSGNPTGNVIYLSKAGIISDASINLYDSSFGTDQTAAIQAVLNTSSASNPLTLYIDLKASCTGLKVKSNTTINILPNCGLILRDHSDNFLLSNYNWTANSNAIVDSNITINGFNGGILNGNGWRNDSNYQANNTHAKGQITLLNFFGVKNVNIINTTFLNASSWCLTFLTSQNVKIDNCIIDDGKGHYIQDGIDFLGMAKGITITNCTITNGDDKIVFCPNSTGGSYTASNGVVYDHSVYTGVDGDQTSIRVDNIIGAGTGKFVALYAVGGNKLSDVHISNLSGTCQSTWLDIENYLPGYTMTTGSQICHNLTFENIGVEVTGYVGYGDVEFPLANVMCSVDNLVFRNISRNSYAQNACSFTFKTATSAPAITIDNLTIDGFYSVNSNPANYPAPGNISVYNATVNKMNILNTYTALGGVFDRPLLNINSTSTVHTLSLQNIRFSPSISLADIQGTVDYLSMNNVIHTGNGASNPTLNITGTVTKALISNYVGNLLYTGTIGTLAQSASVTTP